MQVVWHTLGVGQTAPAQSSTLGWPQMEEPTVRKLAKVDTKACSLGEQLLTVNLWNRMEATKSCVEPGQIQAGCAFQRRPGTIASGGGERRLGLEMGAQGIIGSAEARAIGPL